MAPALSRWLGNCLSLVGASRYLSMCVRNVILCRNLCVSMAARRESLIGESHYESFPNLPEHLKESHRRGLAGETVTGRDERILKRDGTEHWANWQVTPWGDSGESTGGIIIYEEDLTERKRMEALARKSELQYRALFENMSEGIAYCQMIFEGGKPRDYIYLSVNEAFTSISGFRDVEGKRMSEVYAGRPPIGSSAAGQAEQRSVR